MLRSLISNVGILADFRSLCSFVLEAPSPSAASKHSLIASYVISYLLRPTATDLDRFRYRSNPSTSSPPSPFAQIDIKSPPHRLESSAHRHSKRERSLSVEIIDKYSSNPIRPSKSQRREPSTAFTTDNNTRYRSASSGMAGASNGGEISKMRADDSVVEGRSGEQRMHEIGATSGIGRIRHWGAGRGERDLGWRTEKHWQNQNWNERDRHVWERERGSSTREFDQRPAPRQTRQRDRPRGGRSSRRYQTAESSRAAIIDPSKHQRELDERSAMVTKERSRIPFPDPNPPPRGYGFQCIARTRLCERFPYVDGTLPCFGSFPFLPILRRMED